jgi:hypothetical protein
VTHSWRAFWTAASSAETVADAAVVVVLVVGDGVLLVLLVVLVVGSGEAWVALSAPVRMRKPKNAAAAMASRATTPRTSGSGDRRCALCFPTFNQSFRCDGDGVEPVASCSPG